VCSKTGRDGNGRSATTVLPPIVTGVFLFRAGKVELMITGFLLTGIIATGLGLMGWRGKIGRGIGRYPAGP
jgi:hypothetical protein